MREYLSRLRLASVVLGASVLVAFASGGCVVYHGPSPSPIPHAAKAPPRVAEHGAVHRDQGIFLVFDRSWNGYWVRGHPDHYFYGDRYYRWHDGGWQRARRFGGRWTAVEPGAVPAGLRDARFARVRRR